jgi:hypothetical protein
MALLVLVAVFVFTGSAAAGGMTTLGCATLPSGRTVLVAGDREADMVRGTPGFCLYAPAEGASDTGGCTVANGWAPFISGEAPGARRDRLEVHTTLRPDGGPPYVVGPVAAGVDQVVLHAAETTPVPARLIRTTPVVRDRLGLVRRSAFFVGEPPPGADTCRGLDVIVRPAGFVDAVHARTVGYPSREVAVPGSKTCEARAAMIGFSRLAVASLLAPFL